MLVSGRVHPAGYETEPAPTEGTRGRIEAYQVGEENEDDAVSTDKAGQVEVVGARRHVLSKRFLLVFITVMCFMSITTFVSAAIIISGMIGNRCNCSDAVGGNLQRQGSVLSSLMDNHCYN